MSQVDGSQGIARWLSAVHAEQHAITPAAVLARVAPLDPARPLSTSSGSLQLVPALPDWRREANCLGLDPELFFPPQGSNRQAAEAKAVCGGCDVRMQCLVYALEWPEELGVWGGLSERERRVMRRRLPRVARCSRCGGRFTKVASRQRFCGAGCPGLVRVRARRRAS